MELARLFVEVLTVGVKAAIAFAFFLWIAGKLGIPGLAALLGKAGVHGA